MKTNEEMLLSLSDDQIELSARKLWEMRKCTSKYEIDFLKEEIEQYLQVQAVVDRVIQEELAADPRDGTVYSSTEDLIKALRSV